MKTIPLTRGLVAIVDDEDFDRLRVYRWHAAVSQKNRTAYARRNEGTRKIHMHRVILQAPPSTLVDHVNSNGLDNTRGNLRLCTRAENCRHCRKSVRPKLSRFKGITWNKAAGKFQATIRLNRVSHYLGLFTSELAAAQAYDAAARQLHMTFALTNFGEGESK